MAPPKGKNYVQTQQYQPCWQIPKWMAISSGISWPSCTKTFSFCQIYVNFPGHKRSGLWFWKNCTTSHCQHSIQLYAYTVSIRTTKSCNISMSTERKQPWGPLFCFFLCLWSVSIKHTRKTRDCPWLLRRHQCRFAPGDSPGWKEVQILMKWQGGNLRYQIPDTRRANLHRHSVADNTPSAMYLLRTLIVASGPSKD